MGTTRAQRRFDAFRLARERGSLAGSVDATTLPRLADRVIGSRAPIDWRIEGTVDAMGRLALAVLLEAATGREQRAVRGDARRRRPGVAVGGGREAEPRLEVAAAGAPVEADEHCCYGTGSCALHQTLQRYSLED